MQRFIMVRLFHAAIALLAISLIIFLLIRISGDPMDTLLDVDATEEDYARVRAHWGLDKPFPNKHTYYFSCLVLYLFAANNSKVSQYIAFSPPPLTLTQFTFFVALRR